MCATAAHLIERVLPEVDLCQWVLTFPFAWRRRLSQDGALLGKLTRIFVETVSAFYAKRAGDLLLPCTGLFPLSSTYRSRAEPPSGLSKLGLGTFHDARSRYRSIQTGSPSPRAVESEPRPSAFDHSAQGWSALFFSDTTQPPTRFLDPPRSSPLRLFFAPPRLQPGFVSAGLGFFQSVFVTKRYVARIQHVGAVWLSAGGETPWRGGSGLRPPLRSSGR